MIYTAIEILNKEHQIPKGFINHTTWEPQSLPLVALDREIWDKHQLVPWTGPEPVWVELTINNIDANGHPFHLVGLPFAISTKPPPQSADMCYYPQSSMDMTSTSLLPTKA